MKTAIYACVGAITLASIYTATIFSFASSEALPWFHQLTATLVAAMLAVAAAMVVYRHQVRDNDKKTRDLLSFYLYYLLENVWPSREPGDVSFGRVNAHILNELVSSRALSGVAREIIKLQSAIDFYLKFSHASLLRVHENNGTTNAWEKLNIDNSARIIRELAQTCLDKLESGDKPVQKQRQYVSAQQIHFE